MWEELDDWFGYLKHLMESDNDVKLTLGCFQGKLLTRHVYVYEMSFGIEPPTFCIFRMLCSNAPPC